MNRAYRLADAGPYRKVGYNLAVITVAMAFRIGGVDLLNAAARVPGLPACRLMLLGLRHAGCDPDRCHARLRCIPAAQKKSLEEGSEAGSIPAILRLLPHILVLATAPLDSVRSPAEPGGVRRGRGTVFRVFCGLLRCSRTGSIVPGRRK